jgi:hypothetical protein
MNAGVSNQDEERVGFGRPPSATRFKKGQSGNPRGRPRGRRRDIPYDAVLGQMVTVREDGRERRITAAEAFILQLTQKGLGGDSAAARASLAAIEEARARRQGPADRVDVIRIMFMSFGIGPALGTLGLAIRKNLLDEDRVRWELNPWIVEAAIARLGPEQLSTDDQQEVWNNTRTPEDVNWPGWWTVRS